MKDHKYIARFSQGSGVLAHNAIDFYLNDDGKIIEHHWSNGGELCVEADSVPDNIAGYIRREDTNGVYDMTPEDRKSLNKIHITKEKRC